MSKYDVIVVGTGESLRDKTVLESLCRSGHRVLVSVVPVTEMNADRTIEPIKVDERVEAYEKAISLTGLGIGPSLQELGRILTYNYEPEPCEAVEDKEAKTPYYRRFEKKGRKKRW